MFRVVATSFVCVAGLPKDPDLINRIQAFWSNGTEEACTVDVCGKPTKKFERMMNTQPGVQWMDHGGYCGSWAIQRATMAKGAWISQQQVRDHTVAGGGNDNEILETNIDLALKNLKLKAEGFDYEHLPTPQKDSYRKWIKQQLAAGNAVVAMIMYPGRHYPVYAGLRYGLYSHIEPIVGILSDHPLTDQDFYDDDYTAHYNDAGTSTYYRRMDSMIGSYDGHTSSCPEVSGDGMCFNDQRGFGWAIQGFQDEKPGLPLSLTVNPWKSEPNTREGESPTRLEGTITVENLQVGQQYSIYRWDSVSDAFDYTKGPIHRFTAADTKQVYTDSRAIDSDSATYYRCLADSAIVV